MSPSSSKLRRGRPSTGRVVLRSLVLAFVLTALGWSIYVAQQIAEVADQDEAQQADAIAVFGAAEYSGRPSPTLHFRLDHAVELYRKQIAPIVITLGGGLNKDSGNTEGAVGRDYLLAQGIPLGNIIAETHSFDTEQQVRRLASIARENNLRHIVVVSDGTHLFRIRELCRNAGLDVYTSPRATVGHISNYDLTMRYMHEILSYTASKLHLDVGWARRWLAGEEGF
ncbi:YdcF family protein [Edaphobacter flagellatus]|uniref:YdcF family protein n=1 Tax=Edaphobacter flagellatus TaxID=1933044 RepID=UPI0021B29A00|nr:YdcF family protein [Edaphobacter flagellatus]